MRKIWFGPSETPLQEYVLSRMEWYGITAKAMAENSWNYDNERLPEDADPVRTEVPPRTMQQWVRALKEGGDLPDKQAWWVVWALNRCLLKHDGVGEPVLNLDDLRGRGEKQRRDHVEAGARYLSAIFEYLDGKGKNTLLNVAHALLMEERAGRIPKEIEVLRRLAYYGPESMTEEERSYPDELEMWREEAECETLHDEYFPEEQPLSFRR